MNKTELIAEVAAKCAISKKDAEKTVNATFDTIAEALCKGDKVQLVGFGGFETKHREAHMGRKPVVLEAHRIQRARSHQRTGPVEHQMQNAVTAPKTAHHLLFRHRRAVNLPG